jgi:hypothetical protein
MAREYEEILLRVMSSRLRDNQRLVAGRELLRMMSPEILPGDLICRLKYAKGLVVLRAEGGAYRLIDVPGLGGSKPRGDLADWREVRIC